MLDPAGNEGELALSLVVPLSSDPGIAARLAAGLCSTGIGLSLYDSQDNLLYAGGIFPCLVDLQPGPQTFETMIRHCCRTGTGPVFSMPVDDWLAMAGAKRRSAPFRRFEVDLADGRWMLVAETTFEDGALFAALSDITALKTNEKSLRYAHDLAVSAADTDWLTGVPNRRHVMRRLGELAAVRQGKDEPLSIGLIDLDYFKVVNDTYGHDYGDTLLRTFADLGLASVRHDDVFGRVGGEEFMIVVCGSQADAEAILERLRLSLKHAAREGLKGAPHTFSAGVAGWRAGDSVEAIYARADKALYRAKRSGRNRVLLAIAS